MDGEIGDEGGDAGRRGYLSLNADNILLQLLQHVQFIVYQVQFLYSCLERGERGNRLPYKERQGDNTHHLIFVQSFPVHHILFQSLQTNLKKNSQLDIDPLMVAMVTFLFSRLRTFLSTMLTTACSGSTPSGMRGALGGTGSFGFFGGMLQLEGTSARVT